MSILDHIMNSCKIFVGNVPFQCTSKEFNDCFRFLDGFIRAEIIYKSKSEISRGFGFVLFDSTEHARQLIGKTDIICKDRVLRFTEYDINVSNDDNKYLENDMNNVVNYNVNNDVNNDINNDINDNINNDVNNDVNNENSIFIGKNKNYLIIKNLDPNMTRDDLYKIFSQYGNIGRYFIASNQIIGIPKGYGVVEILDDYVYNSLVNQKEIKFDQNTFEIFRWKLCKKEKKIPNINIRRHTKFITNKHVYFD